MRVYSTSTSTLKGGVPKEVDDGLRPPYDTGTLEVKAYPSTTRRHESVSQGVGSLHDEQEVYVSLDIFT